MEIREISKEEAAIINKKIYLILNGINDGLPDDKKYEHLDDIPTAEKIKIVGYAVMSVIDPDSLCS